MSIDLILEVMDHAPADLTSGERLTLIVIAERANDKTRVAIQSTRWNLDTIAHRAGVKRTGLKSIFQGLAKKGCEVRVPVKTNPDGKPVFAFEGTAVTFKVPRLTQRGGHSLPTERGGQGTPSDGQEGMPQHLRGEAVASERGGHNHPQSLKTLKEPSKNSLSGDLPSVPAPCDSGEGDRERDGLTSFSNPNHTPEQRMVIEAGCPERLAAEVVEFIEGANPGIRGIGWWKKLLREGDLGDHVQVALAATPQCQRCEGKGEVWSETFGTMVRCDSCPTGPAALDWQPRSSDPRFRAPTVNVPEGSHTAAWERRRQQHGSAGERKFLRAHQIAAELDAEFGGTQLGGVAFDPSRIIDHDPEVTP